MTLEAIRFDDEGLHLLDQRVLPDVTRWITCRTAGETAEAIRSMVVRGAPAIAIAAAYGMALADDRAAAFVVLAAARPTAVNLRWALERIRGQPDPLAAARALHAEDVAINRRLGKHGASLLSGGVLTLCNTGSLATGGYGTALGMVRAARASGRDVHVYACETRPYRQGARLTAYECAVDGIPCTVIPDLAAGALLLAGRITAVVVGCDRVAANGDTANKLGTYTLAVLARHHGVPFYVAMPLSSYDPATPDGSSIPVEERPIAEFHEGPGDAWNPAFDVTPAALVTAWVTEEGVTPRCPPPRSAGARG